MRHINDLYISSSMYQSLKTSTYISAQFRGK